MIPPREPQEARCRMGLHRWPEGVVPDEDARCECGAVPWSPLMRAQEEMAALRGELARLRQEAKDAKAEALREWQRAEHLDNLLFAAMLREAGEKALKEVAESALSAQQAQIRALVEQWREEAKSLDDWLASALRECAHELEALLIQETPSESGSAR